MFNDDTRILKLYNNANAATIFFNALINILIILSPLKYMLVQNIYTIFLFYQVKLYLKS